jgi:hypothetical protein
MGEAWNEPHRRERTDDTDCEAESAARPGGGLLRIQVVRAIADPVVWRTLSEARTLAASHTAEQVADWMADSVKRKRDQIPPRQRGELVLALDAIRLPVCAFDSVVSSVRERHGAFLESTGFQSVWVVGPTEELTKRLDCEQHEAG